MKRAIKRSHLLIIVVLALLLAIALVYSMLTREGTPQDEGDSIRTERHTSTRRVFVKDLHTLAHPISPQSQQLAERRIYSHAAQDGPNLYTGTIRSGSYTSEMSDGARITRLLVDIEPTKVTYSVFIREAEDARLAEVVCAPQAQQISPTAKCKESDWF